MFFSAVCMKTHKCATDVEQKLDSEKYYMLIISVLTIIRERKTSLTKRNIGREDLLSKKTILSGREVLGMQNYIIY